MFFTGQVMRAGMEGLSSTTKLYPKTMHLDIEVAAMGIIAPEGNLVRTGALLHPSKSTLGLPGDEQSNEIYCLHVRPLLLAQPRPSQLCIPCCCSLHGWHKLTDNDSVVCEGAAEELPQSASKGQAMRLQYIQHPQDESADAAVHLNLAPSYVTYNPVAVQRVMDFFKTDEVNTSFQSTADMLTQCMASGDSGVLSKKNSCQMRS